MALGELQQRDSQSKPPIAKHRVNGDEKKKLFFTLYYEGEVTTEIGVRAVTVLKKCVHCQVAGCGAWLYLC